MVIKNIAMTIAGSDSGAGAGIQADLKTFAANGVYGTSVITALTAQNSVTVAGVHPAPAEFIALQIDTLFDDIQINAVKTGMLFNEAIIRAVADRLEKHNVANLVIDPVMIAKSGDNLLEPAAVNALKTALLPMALVVTPNIPEAESLTGMEIRGVADMERAANRLVEIGVPNVVIKGGHMPGAELTDILMSDGAIQRFTRNRIDTIHTHGTGCTFSAAITAGLAKGQEVLEAAQNAAQYIENAIRSASALGGGHGPVDHFYDFGKGK